MPKWEYHSLHAEILSWIDDKIDKTDMSLLTSKTLEDSSKDGSLWDEIGMLGESGWEMVNAFPVARFTMGENAGYTSHVVFVFKRPLE